MRPHRALRRVCVTPCIVAMALALVCAPAVAEVTITPPSIETDLQPGDISEKAIVVSIPGSTPPVPVDIYFLADTTESMAPAINAIKADVEGLLSGLQMTLGDVQFGVGEYRDFPLDEKFDFAYINVLSLTSDVNDVQSAVQSWATGGGPGDVPEAQFYALDKIATPGDPFGIGWRENAQRLIVWFGDSPGHDPVCDEISFDKGDITEASVINRLTGAGITVIAIGTTTGVPNALNGDPTVDANDYLKPCGVIGGTAGQADRIAAATGGLSVQDIGPAGIAAAIQTLIAQATNTVDVNLIVKGDLEGRVVVVSPALIDLPLPPAGATLDLVFIVQCTGLPCDDEIDPHLFEGSLCAVVNGAEAATADVTITQLVCGAQPAPLRPFALDQVEVITCDVPYEFEFQCRSRNGLPVTASAAGNAAAQPGFVGEIIIDGLSGSYTPPPDTNGLFFLNYTCNDGTRTSNVGQVALWVLTCEEAGGPQTPGQGVPDDGGTSSDDDCAAGFASLFATFTGLCLVSGTRRRRFTQKPA